MAVDKGIRWELLARLCPSTTGAELRSVCTEAGMYAIRARRRSIAEKDFLEAIQKVIKVRTQGGGVGGRGTRSLPPRAHAPPTHPVVCSRQGHKKFSATPKYLIFN